LVGQLKGRATKGSALVLGEGSERKPTGGVGVAKDGGEGEGEAVVTGPAVMVAEPGVTGKKERMGAGRSTDALRTVDEEARTELRWMVGFAAFDF
jgi:hypothetical protein